MMRLTTGVSRHSQSNVTEHCKQNNIEICYACLPLEYMVFSVENPDELLKTIAEEERMAKMKRRYGRSIFKRQVLTEKLLSIFKHKQQ